MHTPLTAREFAAAYETQPRFTPRAKAKRQIWPLKD